MMVRCARCCKPVDSVTKYDDLRGGVIIQVICHGAIDTMRLSYADIHRLGSEGLKQIEKGEGVAFTGDAVIGPD